MVEQHAETAQPTAPRAAPQSGEDAATFLFADIKRHAALPPNISPQDAIRSVMCTFSQHVAGGEARHLWNTLPDAIKPLLDRCMVHRAERAESFTKDQLVLRVAKHLLLEMMMGPAPVVEILRGAVTSLPCALHDSPLRLPLDGPDETCCVETPRGPRPRSVDCMGRASEASSARHG